MEGFNLDEDFDNDVGEWVPDTPDQDHMAPDLNEDWVNFDQSNTTGDPANSESGTPINSPITPQSPISPNSQIQSPSPSTA